MANESEKKERNRMGQQPTASGRSPAPSVSRSNPEAANPDTAEAKPDSLLPSLTLPKGGGAIRGIGEKLTTNALTGTGALSVPIATSPGRSGFQFGLTLDYDSGAGNGPFGIGWHLSPPAITRKTDKGLPRYANDEGDDEDRDVFILSGAEDLVPVRVPDGACTRTDVAERGDYRVQRYRPRGEGLFARIERWTHQTSGDMHWRVTTRDNTLNIYGRDPQARIADPEQPERIFSWLLEETRDDRGNVARYTYKSEDAAGVDPRKASEANRFAHEGNRENTFLATAQRYLKRIQYGNRVPVSREAPAPTRDDDWLFEAVLDYGEHDAAAPTPHEEKPWFLRMDPFSNYRPTFEVRTYRICQRVLMFHRFAELGPGPVLVRSTDFAYDQGPVVTYLTSVTQAGYLRDGTTGAYQRAVMPSLDLQYIRPVVHDEVQSIDRDSLAGVADGIDGTTAQWVDLDGEGIPGVLVPTERSWYYKANRGGGKLDPPALMRALPSPAELGGGVQQLADLGADGNLDLVQYTPPLSGYFERTADRSFVPFVPLSELPNIDWNDPNLRFVDIDGDGLADVLITENDAFVWYRSRGKNGFESGGVVPHSKEELKGPTVIFADGSETIQLADMSGDGLVDIVRVRSGEVCYWPNLGYGHFGRRVTLDASPRFDTPDMFDPKRVRFADIDGSGPSDIVYLGRDGVRLYFNQSGNGFSAATKIESLPPIDSLSSLNVVDLLGQGTVCLVLSTPLPDPQLRRVTFIDLMGGKKPHLLESVVNNLGAETRITFASSTKFYLADKAAGIPWLTRLSFPVQVVERIDHIDGISKSHLTTMYRYRHGFYDGVEREFRGFARVEQLDAEEFTVGTSGIELFQPPTRTVSWFHTGAWLEKERIEAALAKEYFQSGPAPLLLPDTILPSGMTIQDEREAARALRGRMLRQEIYANDADVVGPVVANAPFAVTEQSFEVRLLQTSKDVRHGVFFVFPRETIGVHTERNPVDPRVTHEFVLDVDEFGNVTRKATIAYARANPVEEEQKRAWATLVETSYVNHPGEDFYRIGVLFEDKSFELTGLPDLPLGGKGLLMLAELLAAIDGIDAAHTLPYDMTPTEDGTERRMLDHRQRFFYQDDLSGPLPLAQIGSRALPFETYQLALTRGLVAEIVEQSATLCGIAFDPAVLLSEGHYVQRDADYWTAGGRLVFDPSHFYLAKEAIDQFGKHHFVTYDSHDLLVIATRDPVGNIVQAANDYRVLSPELITDANLNRTAVAFDALGIVVKTAVMGKTTTAEGDSLADPTTRLEYDLLRWQTEHKPVFVHSFAREQHGAANTRFQESYTYSDGFGRVVMKKVQAEPGDVLGAGFVTARWVGTGRTVFNNKGKVVKQYESFFSPTFDFENEAQIVESGVTPVFHFDALDRIVRIELPNGTESRVAFDAWKQEDSDPNDTVLASRWYRDRGSPDPNGPEPRGIPEQRAAWLAARHANTPTARHFDALGRVFLVLETNRAYLNGGTPTEESLETRTVLDVSSNVLAVIDARQAFARPTNPIATFAQRFDVLSRAQRIDSADAGTRLIVPDVAGKPLRGWDSRGQVFRYSYDALQRPSHLFVQKTVAEHPDDNLTERLVVRTVYGEALDPLGLAPTNALSASAAQRLNLRGQAYRIYDCAGVATNDSFDFKANLLSSTRRLARDFHVEPKWNTAGSDITVLVDPDQIQARAEAALDPVTTTPLTRFSVRTEYDALNRVTKRTTPDGSVTTPTYNEAGFLEKLAVGIHGGTANVVVANIDYNARGQRLLYEYADPTITSGPVMCQVAYTYDPFTFRMTKLLTHRSGDGTTVTKAKLQDLTYTYDPVGNVVEIDDSSDESPIFGGATPVRGDGFYRYDALYRLVQAEGREHPGQQGVSTQPRADFEVPLDTVPHPNDLQALLRYLEKYTYDRVGNIEKVAHTTMAAGGGPGPSWTQWTRRYGYAPNSNRLLGTSEPGDPDGTFGAAYGYTGNGAMKSMPHLPGVDWDYADHMEHANQAGGGDVFFTYDSNGQRVRKVWVHSGLVEERIYLGGWETFRRRTLSQVDSPVVFERETLHVMDDKRRIAMVETKTVDSEGGGPTASRWRFQLDNLVGSSVVEIDAAGSVITCEEYHPYGSTAFHTATGAAEVSAKRYRYTGKEKDEETGLYYHGARYYAPWLGRWTAPDPLKLTNSGGTDLNPFAYVGGRPLGSSDPTGTQEAVASSMDENGNPTLLDESGVVIQRSPSAEEAGGAPSTAAPTGPSIKPGTPAQERFQEIFFREFAQEPTTAHAQTLLEAFTESGIPGETIQERFSAILALTAGGGPYLHFSETTIGSIGTGRMFLPETERVGDTGFRVELQDSARHQSSSNQIGHFLTASDIGYSNETRSQFIKSQETFQREHPILYALSRPSEGGIPPEVIFAVHNDVLVRAIVGHEQYGDVAQPGTSGGAGLGAIRSASSEDVQNFLAGRLELIKVNTERPGASQEDLLLTFIGYRFGAKVAQGQFSSPAQARQWLKAMLTPNGLESVPNSSPFYAEAQEILGITNRMFHP